VGKEKSLRVKVVKIHPLEGNAEGETSEKKLEGACDSPSSDKENASQENQKKEQQLTREESPRETRESRRESLSEYNTFGSCCARNYIIRFWVTCTQIHNIVGL
jgi:bromodomain adjacent to zinc finger domain protein 1B